MTATKLTVRDFAEMVAKLRQHSIPADEIQGIAIHPDNIEAAIEANLEGLYVIPADEMDPETHPYHCKPGWRDRR